MTAEPRPVEGAVYDDVYTELSLALGTDDTADEDVDFKRDLTARIMRHFATADRENAELRERLRHDAEQRREVERLRALPYLNGVRMQDHWASERDDLRAQLAAAQAQLAEARDERDRVGEWINHYKAEQEAIIARYMARLEAVRATMRQVADELRDLGEAWLFDGDTDRPLNPGYDLAFNLADRLDVRSTAALSAAPQPEPDLSERYFDTLLTTTDDPDEKARIEEQRQKHRAQPVTPASDEPARCGCARCDNARRAGESFPESLCRFMIVCATCGNKRCPRAAWHGNECTGSNEPGQPGSNYPAVRWADMFGIAPDFDR